jgi:uncharacterized protein (TIGR03084 family)
MDIVDDLQAEQEHLESLLSELSEEQWAAASAAPGWTITDVVVHLGQTEELVAASLASGERGETWDRGGRPLDDAIDEVVKAERAPAGEVFDRWRRARRQALSALRAADPNQRVPWAATPLRPAVLATTRLAEHWAHGLDITAPLNLPFPDTDRLRHIAWLGHRTLPYAFAVEGLPAHDVYCELKAPDGSVWRYGPAGADSMISGSAAEFCRVGARRLAPEDSRLEVSGPHAADALRVLRNYAA